MSRRTNHRSIRSCSIARLTASLRTVWITTKHRSGLMTCFAREGYIFVYGDVRGRYMSEGVYEDVRPYIPNKTGNQIDENDGHL